MNESQEIHLKRKDSSMIKPAMKSELLTFKETSDWIRVKVPTLRKWAAKRIMPTIRIGRGLRVPVAWVEEMIQKGYRPAVERE